MKTQKFLEYGFIRFCLKALVVLSFCLIPAPDLVAQSSTTLQSTWAKTKPTLDGRINSSEWSDARKVSKNFDLINIQGKKVESHFLTIYVKNDGSNLYLAGQLDKEELDGTMSDFDISTLVMDTFSLGFDNNNDGVLQSGEDKKSLSILNGTPYVKDEHRLSPAEQQQGKEDSSEPQNVDGKITHTSSNGGYYQFELSIPFSSGDPFDVQLQPGQKIRWNLFYIDKFSITMKEMRFGGWFGGEMESSRNWGYLQLASSQSQRSTPAPAAPTVVSKAGSSKDIQVFAALANDKDLTPNRLQFIGSHYDLVLTSFPFKKFTDQLKQANPNIPVLLFSNPYFAFGDKFWNPSSSSAKRNAEKTYSLKTKENKIINYGGPTYSGMEFDQNLPLMDVTNPQWQQYFASQARKHVDAGGLDGLFLDTMEEDIPPFALAPGNKFPKGYSAESWKKGNYEFLKKVKAAFAGTNKLIFFNGVTRGPGRSGGIPNRGMLDMLDGTALESYSIYMSMDKNQSTKQWYFKETILKDLKQVSEQGKSVVIEVYGNEDDETLRLYALTTFLLVQNDHTYFYFTKKSDAGGLRWRPEWDAKIGHPLGDYQKLANQIHSRDFSNGKVLVNPSNKTISIPLSGQYKDWKGNRVGGSIKMPAYSGALLLND